jgi:hypothetical protein
VLQGKFDGAQTSDPKPWQQSWKAGLSWPEPTEPTRSVSLIAWAGTFLTMSDEDFDGNQAHSSTVSLSSDKSD